MSADEKINLLIVDDEEAFLASIRRRLQIRDFNVIVADRGTCALDIARANPIDVAVVDLKMPGLSGRDVILRLKKDHPWLEIIILTGHGSFDPETEDFCNQAFSFLAKPCDLETLMAVARDAYRKTIMNKHGLSSGEINHLSGNCPDDRSENTISKLKAIDKSLTEKACKGDH